MAGWSPTPDVLKAGKTMIGVKFRKMRLNVLLDTKFHSQNARNFAKQRDEETRRLCQFICAVEFSEQQRITTIMLSTLFPPKTNAIHLRILFFLSPQMNAMQSKRKLSQNGSTNIWKR